jgi:hypothetical protein
LDNLGFSTELISGIKYGAVAFLLLTGFFAVMRFRRTQSNGEELSYTTAGANDVNLDDAESFASYISPTDGDSSAAVATSATDGSFTNNSASEVTSQLMDKVAREKKGTSDGYELLFRDNLVSDNSTVATSDSSEDFDIKSPEGYLMRLNDTIGAALNNVPEISNLQNVPEVSNLPAKEPEFTETAIPTASEGCILTEQSWEMLKGFIPPEYHEPVLRETFSDVVVCTSRSDNDLYHIYMMSPDLTDKIQEKRKFIQSCRKLSSLSAVTDSKPLESHLLPEFVSFNFEIWPVLILRSNLTAVTLKIVDRSWLCPSFGKWIVDLAKAVRYVHDNEWASGRILAVSEALIGDGDEVKAILNRFNFNSTDCLPEAKKKDIAAIKELIARFSTPSAATDNPTAATDNPTAATGNPTAATGDLRPATDDLTAATGKPSPVVMKRLAKVVDAILLEDIAGRETAIDSFMNFLRSLPCVSNFS